jgi:hypothetical protein
MGVILRPVVSENVMVIIALFALAGGGIIVVDALVIRKIRRLPPPTAQEEPGVASLIERPQGLRERRTIDE